jgi:CYTH domain-containing protein
LTTVLPSFTFNTAIQNLKEGNYMEIERTFLIAPAVAKLILKEYPIKKELKVLQVYVAIEEKGNENRIRRKSRNGEVCYGMTVKSYGNLVRKEIKAKITEQFFKKLFPMARGRWFRKKIFVLNYPKVKFFLSFYEKPLGIIIAEIEFKTTRQAKKFIPPDYFGKEITKDKNFRGRYLAERCSELRKKESSRNKNSPLTGLLFLFSSLLDVDD